MFYSVCDLRVVSLSLFYCFVLRLATYGVWTALVIAMEASVAPTDGESAPAPVTEQTETAAPADVPANQPLAAIKTPKEYILGPDVKILEKSDGTYAISTGGMESAIPKPHFDKLLEASKANVSSNISSMTGILVDRTRQLSSSVKQEDEEPIEWGDMDPQQARFLQDNSEALRAFKASRKPLKQPRLDVNSMAFPPAQSSPAGPSSNVPTATVEQSLPEVTPDNLKKVLAEYHQTHVMPALASIEKRTAHDLRTPLP